jgi:hypothetical protein
MELMSFIKGANEKGKKIYYFQIPFSNILGMPGLEEASKFYLLFRKRCYVEKGDLIASENSLLLSHDVERGHILKNIFHLKILIDSRKVERSDFVKFLSEKIMDRYTVDLITRVSDQRYADAKIERRGSKRKSSASYMGFADKHYRELFRISTGIKLILPLATHYIVSNGIEDKSEFLFQCYKILFKKFSSGDLYGKLKMYAHNIFRGSGCQNMKMWDRLLYEGTTTTTASVETIKRIIVDIIHRGEYHKDIVAFIFTVIDNQASVRARSKFMAEYYIVGGLTEQSSISRKVVSLYDEELIIFQRLHAKQVILDRLWTNYVTNTKKEKYYEDLFLKIRNEYGDPGKKDDDPAVKPIYPSNVHNFLMVTLFTKHFRGNTKGVHNSGSRENFLRLALLFKIMLEAEGFKLLPKLILCTHRLDRNIRIKTVEVENYFDGKKKFGELLRKRFSFIDESATLYRNVKDIVGSQWHDPFEEDPEKANFSVSLDQLYTEIYKFIEFI